MNTKNEKIEEKEIEVYEEDGLDFLNTSNESKYDRYYFCKVRTKKDIIPHFEISRKIDGVVKVIGTKVPVDKISGKLINIEFSEGEYQGQIIKSVIFKLETLNDTGKLVAFRIQVSRNQALLNWLNCLIGFDGTIDTFEMSLWKDKNTGYNKSTCRINGTKPKWAYTLEQMEEKREKIYDKKGLLMMTKSEDLYNFMEEELKNKLDVLLPNRFKPEQEAVFNNFVEVSTGETNIEDLYDWDKDVTVETEPEKKKNKK